MGDAFSSFMAVSLAVGFIQIVLFFVAVVAIEPDEEEDYSNSSATSSKYSSSTSKYSYSNHPAVKSNPDTSVAANILLLLWMFVGVSYLILCYAIIHNVR